MKIKFSNELANKVVAAQFNIEKLRWYRTIFYYMIDSKIRQVKRLDSFLKEQVDNPSQELVDLAQSLRDDDIDITMVNILKWVLKNAKYKYDKDNYGKLEYWASAEETFESGLGDCLAWDTKLLKEDLSLVNIEDINIGDNIYGKDGELTRVINKIDKGILGTKRYILRNGTEVIATDEHKFILSSGEEVLAKDLRLNDELMVPKTIEYINKDEIIDTDYYYLKGLFIADGWTDSTHNGISISGKDGFKKESQKNWVKKYCENNGLEYYYHERYIRIKSLELKNDFIKCGKHAIDKHIDIIPSIKENQLALLEGLKADSHTNKHGSLCFGTISKKLKLQLRILYRMLGYSVYEKEVSPTRTQFGKNNIYRIYPRLNREIKLKIIGIIENGEEQVYDIETENHQIYLPENDCVVHNCDDMNSLIYILARLAGVPSYVLYCCIGNVVGGGHFWLNYYSYKCQKVVTIDATYYPTSMAIKSRPKFELTTARYVEIWYCFNETGIWKYAVRD